MARRLIFKESGLTGSVPSGYKAFGMNGATFSSLDTSGSFSTLGGSSGGSLSQVPQTDTIYVDPILGTDDTSTGRGNIEKPYATVEYALSNTTNTGTVTGTTTNGSSTLTSVSDTSNIKVGQYITGTNIPYDSVVVSKTSNTIVLSKPSTGSGSNITLTWWTIKKIKITSSLTATGSWFKPGFWIDATGCSISFGNFAIFNKTSATLVPEVIKGGFWYGTHSGSRFIYTLSTSSHDIFIDIDGYYSLGTAEQLYIIWSPGGRNITFNCPSFDARYGSIGGLRGSGLIILNGYYYGLTGGITFYSSANVNGNIETPASVYAIDVQFGSFTMDGQIRGSLRTTSQGQVYTFNLNGTIVGTTVYLGNAGIWWEGCNINGNITCSNLYSTGTWSNSINGRVIGNVTCDSGQLTISEFQQGNLNISNSKVYITNFGSFTSEKWYGNITLTSGGELNWHGGITFAVSGGYNWPTISVGSGSTLNLFGRLMGEITSLAGTLNVYSSGYLWITKKTPAVTGTLNNNGGTIELTRNGYLIASTESSTNTPTIEISSGTYSQDGGKLFCSNSDSKSGLIRKTATGGKVILRGQSYLKVANGLAPLQILSNTGTTQDIMDFSVITNGASGYRLADTFSDTTYGTAYAPNLLVNGNKNEDSSYSF